MRKFFIEFEFKSNFENYYWFPLTLHAETLESAEILAKAVQKAIEQNYTLKRKTQVQPIIDDINTEYFADYVKQRLRGRISILNFNVWKFTHIDSIPELNFNEHLELINSSDNLSPGKIASTISRQKFPVNTYYSDSNQDFKEFLSVNVVAPHNV